VVDPAVTAPFVKSTVDGEHTAAGLVIKTVGSGLTVTERPVLFACSQGVTPDVNTTVTTNGLVYGLVGLVETVKVLTELLAPTFMPFTCHWYNGDETPPEGVAVKVIELPVHIALSASSELTLTVGVITGFIVNCEETSALKISWFPLPVPVKLSIVINNW